MVTVDPVPIARTRVAPQIIPGWITPQYYNLVCRSRRFALARLSLTSTSLDAGQRSSAHDADPENSAGFCCLQIPRPSQQEYQHAET